MRNEKHTFALDMQTLTALYRNYTGTAPDSISPLKGAGSNRKYYRLTGPETLIGVCGEQVDENRAFIYLSGHFASHGLPVPRVVACSADGLHYLQEDLGTLSLFDAISSGRATGSFSAEEVALLAKTVRRLADIQFLGAGGLDFSRCYPQAAFDRRTILWDLNYFKYCFLLPSGVKFREDRLEDDFRQLADGLLADEHTTFMYRDFQSRNVMLRAGEPWFIDFQGGRRGPYLYDVASFLWQARANLNDGLREQLFDEYVAALRRYLPDADRCELWLRLRHFVLLRMLQTLGAYGFRGKIEGKPHFLSSIPAALKNLRKFLETPIESLGYLQEVLLRMSGESEPVAATSRAETQDTTLTVAVGSFSYKRGLPVDTSGNGGGFIFDCRAIHNPGRYERFRQMTGQDEAVVRFIEENGEAARFLSHVYALVDASVDRYLSRGFTHLTVDFGCTGGQHRSVYCAERLSEHLKSKYPQVNVELSHREAGNFPRQTPAVRPDHP